MMVIDFSREKQLIFQQKGNFLHTSPFLFSPLSLVIMILIYQLCAQAIS